MGRLILVALFLAIVGTGFNWYQENQAKDWDGRFTGQLNQMEKSIPRGQKVTTQDIDPLLKLLNEGVGASRTNRTLKDRVQIRIQNLQAFLAVRQPKTFDSGWVQLAEFEEVLSRKR